MEGATTMAFKMREVVKLPATIADMLVPQCPTGKTGFKTKREAQHSVRGINRQQQGAMSAFRCHYCDCYHLGHRR